MKKFISTSALTICCLVGLLLLSSNGALKTAKAADGKSKMQSTQADFNEFCQVMQGRWIVDVIWIADWPGFGKKGDKVTAYAEWNVQDGGAVLTGRFHCGPGAGTVLVHYDAGVRQIKERVVTSGGTVRDSIVYKRDGKWRLKTTGSNSDGAKIVGNVTITISDEGNTHHRTGSTTIDGKAADPLRDVFHRIGD